MMTPMSPHQPPINEWYSKPCLPPHHREAMMMPVVEHQHMVSSLPVEQSMEHSMVSIPPLRHTGMVTSEPHYSVPRNNSRVAPLSSDRGNVVSPLSADQETDHTGSGVTGGHTAQSSHHKPEPELDKTPTNEAGKMMDLLETVRCL